MHQVPPPGQEYPSVLDGLDGSVQERAHEIAARLMLPVTQAWDATSKHPSNYPNTSAMRRELLKLEAQIHRMAAELATLHDQKDPK